MTDTSGPTSASAFAHYDPDTQSWKMWPATGLWGSIEYSETLPKTGSMRDGYLYEHPTLAPPTTANAYSSSLRTLPTVRAQMAEDRNTNVWRRPDGQPQNLENALARIPEVAAMLPTPKANDAYDNNSPAEAKRRDPALTCVRYHFPMEE